MIHSRRRGEVPTLLASTRRAAQALLTMAETGLADLNPAAA